MRSLLAVLVLVVCSTSLASTKYSDLADTEREAVEMRLRDIIPKYRIAVEIAIANIRGSMTSTTSDNEVLASATFENFGTIDNLFAQVAEAYTADVRNDAFTAGRGQQRISDLRREGKATEQLMWAVFRRPVEDQTLRNQFLDSALIVESVSPVVVRVTPLKRPGCLFTVYATTVDCN